MQLKKFSEADVRKIINWGVGLVAVVLIGAFAVLPSLSRIHPDFIGYYLTGRMVTRGENPTRIYEYTWYQRQTVYAGIDDEPSTIGYNPPPTALALLPLGWLDPKPASIVWLAANLVMAMTLLTVLARSTGLPFAAGLVLLLGATLSFRNNLTFGQIYIMLTLLVAAALAFRDAGFRFLAGTLLGIVTAIKIFPVPLFLYFVWRREWRTVIGFITGLAMIFAGSVFLLGWETHVEWATAVLPRVLKGFGDNPGVNIHTWNSLLLKLFFYNETVNPDPLFRSTFVFWLLRDLGTFTLLACAFFAARSRDDALALSVVVLVLLIISPSTRSYHLILGVIPLAYWGMHLVRQGRWHVAAVVMCLFVVATSPLPYRFPDLFLRLGALVGIAILLLRELQPWRVPTWVLSSIVGVGLIHATVASLPDKQDTAVLVTPDASIVVSPTVRAGALVYSAISNKGYTLRGGVPSDLRFAGHVFGTRFARESNTLFFELAEHCHSEILEWRDGTTHRWTPPNMNCVAPAPSRDGEKIVVVCNGALYLFSAPGQGRLILSVDGEIAEPDLSPDGQHVVFAWRRNEQWSIYETDLCGRDPVRLTNGRHHERGPRYSPSGAWVAFSRQDPTADIWVIERETGRELRITQHPDNDTEPEWSNDANVLYFVSDRHRAFHQGAVYRITLPDDVTKSGS